MKISKETIAILQSFQSINGSIIFRKGSKLVSFAYPSEEAYAEATITEEIPFDFGIYDLSRFLSVLSAHTKKAGDCDLKCDGNQVIIGSNKAKTKYTCTDIELIKSEPPSEIEVPEGDVSFDLSEESIKWMFNMSTILGVPNFSFESDGSGIVVNVCDISGIIADASTLEIADYKGVPFKFILKTQNVKLLDGDYKVDLSQMGMAKFTNKKLSLFYCFAFEMQSQYGTNN